MVKRLVQPPRFQPCDLPFPSIPCFQYKGSLAHELKKGRITEQDAKRMLETMLAIRAFEEMILRLRSNAYPALENFQYRGPTHLSIGQEAAPTGACFALAHTDYITSTHRGHGDAVAKGYVAILRRTDEELRQQLGPGQEKLSREELESRAIEDHIFRTAAELFGKEDGYCKGRGGGMHIADFSSGNLGANAIVGGSTGIATGAAFSIRYRKSGQVVLCFAGDGAYANGVVLESLNMANMAQFNNELAETKFGPPIIFVILNNLYGMTGKQRGEVSGVDYLARRAAGFSMNNMHAEVVSGMDVLAVVDGIARAADLARAGEGPILRELIAYRFHGHSLSDPRHEYRSREEEEAWKPLDPIATFSRALVEEKILSGDEVAGLREAVEKRNERAAVRAAASSDPDPSTVCRYVFTEKAPSLPEEAKKPRQLKAIERPKRQDGQLNMRDAIKEALLEEMARDNRVITYGEDIADYGGAFKVTKGLLETFGRDRVFNASISEAAICGTATGAAMTGLRPVVELMYSDFEFQAGDQIFNQAAKWSYMSGGALCVPLVVRTSAGAGKGYGGQHSQSLESHSTHTPGLVVAVPSGPYEAKGLLKTAIRSNDPVMFVESQELYNMKAAVPEDDYTIPFGKAAIKRKGKDLTVVSYGFTLWEAMKAAEQLEKETGKSAEVIDPQTLIPLDLETILDSVRKTGKVIVVSQAVRTGSYTGEIASRIQEAAFDHLDAPVVRLGAQDAISPQSHVLERAYLPYAEEILAAMRRLLG
ncbi:MAG: dehydrogenase E1 component subunit alpha/beta [Planctomycetota bacterium]